MPVRTPVSWSPAFATRSDSPAPASKRVLPPRRSAARWEMLCFSLSSPRAMPVRTSSSLLVRSVLDKSRRVTESFHVVPVLAGLFLAHFLLRLGQILGVPVGPVPIDSGLELAHLFRGCIEFQLGHAVDVDEEVRFLRRRIIEIHFWNLERFQPLLQLLVGKIEPEFGRTYCVNGVESCHAVVALVPALIPLPRIYAQQYIRPDGADDCRCLLRQLRLRRIFQHPVVVSHPLNVLFRRPQQSLRSLLFGPPDACQALRCYIRIIRTLVVIGVDHDVDLVVISIEERNPAAGAKHIIVRVGSEDQKRFVLYVLQAGFLSLNTNHCEGQDKKTHQYFPHECCSRSRFVLFDTYKVAEILSFVEGLTMSPGHIITFLTGFPPGCNQWSTTS